MWVTFFWHGRLMQSLGSMSLYAACQSRDHSLVVCMYNTFPGAHRWHSCPALSLLTPPITMGRPACRAPSSVWRTTSSAATMSMCWCPLVRRSYDMYQSSAACFWSRQWRLCITINLAISLTMESWDELQASTILTGPTHACRAPMML